MSDLELSYQERYTKALQPLAQALETQLQEYLEGEPRIDRVNARAKSIDRFMKKASKIEDKKQKYSEPLHQIQDQIGARIITFYRSDIDRVSKIILKYFRPIEAKDIQSPSDFREKQGIV
jgi:putative GTP pyrophosphokinase